MNKFLAIGIVVVALIGLVSGVLLVQRQQQLKSQAAGTCSNNPAGTNAPNNYSWVANCSTTCASNNDCPKNTADPSNVDPATSAWCYGFDSPGNRCLQLQYTGTRTTVPDDCKSNPSGTNAPSGYSWVADCSKFCQQNSECPQNTSDPSNVDPKTSNWCYGFNAAPRCLQLKYIGSVAAPTTTPTPAQGCPNTPPFNGVACTVQPPGSQCAADYQWCFSGCCRYTGSGSPLPTSAPTPTQTPTGSITPTSVPGGGGSPEGSKCDYDILDKSGRSVKAGPIYENELYTFKITMLNTVKAGKAEDWIRGTHTLRVLNNTASIWGIPQAFQLTKDKVPQGDKDVFNIDVVASPLQEGDKNFEDRPISFSMANAGGSFGAACEPEVRVLRRAQLVSTKCYVISEDANVVNSVTNCEDSRAKPYTAHQANLNFNLSSNPGQKTIYVKFFDNNNRPSNNGTPITKTVIYSPDPKITDVDCSYDPTPNASGTAYAMRGSGFGVQTIGSKVKVGNQEAAIGSWNANTIIARVDQRMEGTTPVQVLLEDGRKADGSCAVGVTTATLTVKNQCTSAGQFATGGIEVKIYSSGPEPFARQTIKTDKDGNAQAFSPKLEKNKIYTMIVKTPGSLAKGVVFNTGSGTSVVGPLVMPVGNIAPSPVTDSVINSLDYSALVSQWSPVKDVSRPADLNKDSRINSVDYACMKLNFNKQDETFTLPTVAPTPTSTPQPSPTPTVSISPTPTETPSPTPDTGSE